MLASIAEREQSRPKVKNPRLAFLQVGGYLYMEGMYGY